MAGTFVWCCFIKLQSWFMSNEAEKRAAQTVKREPDRPSRLFRVVKPSALTMKTEGCWLTKGVINCTDGCNRHYEEDNRNCKWKLCVYGWYKAGAHKAVSSKMRKWDICGAARNDCGRISNEPSLHNDARVFPYRCSCCSRRWRRSGQTISNLPSQEQASPPSTCYVSVLGSVERSCL